MAKQIITKITDDIDGGDADETVQFAVDGVSYEIDLSAKNAAKLREFMSAYQEAGTRLGRVLNASGPQLRSYRSASPQTAVSRAENQRIRAWAVENGYELADRGRIPQHIVDAYNSNTPNPTWVAAQKVAEEVAAKKPPAKKTTTAAKKAAAASFSGA